MIMLKCQNGNSEIPNIQGQSPKFISLKILYHLQLYPSERKMWKRKEGSVDGTLEQVGQRTQNHGEDLKIHQSDTDNQWGVECKY